MLQDLWNAVDKCGKQADITEAFLIQHERFIPPDDPTVADDCLDMNTPETLLIAKDTKSRLSWEAKQLLRVISELPEEMFMTNGKFRKMDFFALLKREIGWERTRTNAVIQELALKLKS